MKGVNSQETTRTCIFTNKEDLKWVFLSHSNKDYLQVRKIRNKLEEKDLYPIMFYLKCLENAPNESVLDIIKQEIEARPRFVLCQSENTLKSYWVQQEIEYIKSIKRPYEIINLNDSNSIARGIDSIYKRSNVLIISSRVEKDISNKIEQMGYNTYHVDENMVTYNYFGGMNFQQYENTVYQKCLHSLKNGYCLLLLYDQTEFYKTHYQAIINIAMSNKEYIDYLIPIIMEENIKNIPSEFDNLPNFLDASIYSNEIKADIIANHLQYIDILKNL